jgi:2-oxoglutarate ferredoxin oxidoreductase subunit delta
MAKQRPNTKMTGKIVIDTERCKGCGLCIAVCPKGSIVISSKSNKSGYFPAEASNAECTGCALCAIICPDVVIRVFSEEDTASVHPSKKSKTDLIKEKT